MQNIEKNASETADKITFFSSTKNKILVASAIVVVLFASLWIWKAVEISNLKKDNEKKETLLKQKTNELLLLSDYKYLKLLAKPYAWAIRTEMMKGNIEAVNLYANDMVKEKTFKPLRL